MEYEHDFQPIHIDKFWRKMAVAGLAVASLIGVDKYVDYKIDQVTRDIHEQIQQDSIDKADDIANTMYDRFRSDMLDFLEGDSGK